MTVIEAINAIDELKPNEYTQPQKIKWLSTLDGMVHQFMSEYIGFDDAFSGYTEDNLETVLLVDEPYDEIYLLWLESKIDYSNAEYAKYNNSTLRFNDIFDAFKKQFNRTHKHKQPPVRFY